MSLVGRVIRKIGTHSGAFHSDEALAISMLLKLDECKGAEIIRSRDQSELESLDMLVDVGGEYDPSRLRFDHHQRGFGETFSDAYSHIKLSSAGLIYRHFGKQVISKITGLTDEKKVNRLYQRLYRGMIAAMDGIDNGVPQYAANVSPAYVDSTSISSRISRMNPRWNESISEEETLTRFLKAVEIAGIEFEEQVDSLAKGWLPAGEIFDSAVENRLNSDPTGSFLVLDQFIPWKDYYFEMLSETKDSTSEAPLSNLKFIVYPSGSSWRILCVPIAADSFVCKLPLPEAWRGLRDSALDAVTGVPGGVFIHHNGFTGGHQTKEGIINLIKLTLEESQSGVKKVRQE